MFRIQKASYFLLHALTALLVLLPLKEVVFWSFIDTEIVQTFLESSLSKASIVTPEGIVYYNQIIWNFFNKSIFLGVSLLGLFPFLMGLYILKNIFSNYYHKEIFSAANAINYRWLGWLFFIDALIATPLSHMGMVLAATMSNAEGHRYISLNFGTPNLETLFCGFIIIVISWVMFEASKIQEDQHLTI
jgi:hypothetical protein